MKIVNTLEWPDHFMRRMAAWCCREIGLPVRSLKKAAFRRSSSAWGGRAYLREGSIGVRVGDAKWFPQTTRRHTCLESETIADRLECLVDVTAHEVAHLEQFARRSKSRRNGGAGGSERNTQRIAYRTLRTFRENRDALVAEWSREPEQTAEKPKATIIEKRAAKAATKLAEWERKQKVAARKVREYRRRVSYYEKKYGPETLTAAHR